VIDSTITAMTAVHCTHTSSVDNDVSSEATRAQLLVYL
jgi:hypothetical protein